MWIKSPGKIVNGLDFLGAYEVCVYLLRGKEAMLLGGGMSWIAPSLEDQLSKIDFDPASLKYLVILHSHFDHCGAVPYLKRKFPQAQVLASEYASSVLSKEKAVGFISAANQKALDKLDLDKGYERLDLKIDAIQVDRVVREGDIVDLGNGIEARFMETPGHTKGSIAVYTPKLKALFPSDVGPPPSEDASEVYYLGPQYDFYLYMQSLQRLANCEIEICAFEHRGVLTGNNARAVLHDGLRATEKLRDRIIEIYQQTHNLDDTVRRLSHETVGKAELFSFIDEELGTAVLKTVVQNVLRYANLISEMK